MLKYQVRTRTMFIHRFINNFRYYELRDYSKYPVGARYHRALIPWDNEKSFNKEALSNTRNNALSKDSAETVEQLFRTFIFRLWEVFKL